MITYGVVISAATGSSINTAFSLIASNLPLSYQMSVYNLTSGIVGLAVAKSLPTASTTEQKYVASNGTLGLDSNINQPIISEGQNLYMRVATTSIVSMHVIINLDR